MNFKTKILKELQDKLQHAQKIQNKICLNANSFDEIICLATCMQNGVGKNIYIDLAYKNIIQLQKLIEQSAGQKFTLQESMTVTQILKQKNLIKRYICHSLDLHQDIYHKLKIIIFIFEEIKNDLLFQKLLLYEKQILDTMKTIAFQTN